MNVYPTLLISDVCFQKQILEFFYFESEALLSKLVKLCSYFFQKNNFEQKFRMFYFHQKVNLFSNRPYVQTPYLNFYY